MASNLRVIGAGMGRTGTTSLKLALEHLLGAPCFHFIEYKLHPELMAPWQSLAAEVPLFSEPEAMPDIPPSRWQQVMPNYVACVDEPAAFYWLPLSRAYPDAVIILSVRDTDRWWASMKALLDHRMAEWQQAESISAGRRAFLEFENAIYGDEDELYSETANKAMFEKHNRAVMDYAERHPAFRKRLRVWNVSQGWEPICQVLGLPVPDIPFPHANKAGEFHGY